MAQVLEYLLPTWENWINFLPPGLASAIVDIWGVNQQTGSLSFSVSLPLKEEIFLTIRILWLLWLSCLRSKILFCFVKLGFAWKKMQKKEQVFSPVVKMPTCHIILPGLQSWLWFLIPAPQQCSPYKAVMMAQVLGVPTRAGRLGLSSSSLIQPWLLQTFEEWTSIQESLSFPVSLPIK